MKGGMNVEEAKEVRLDRSRWRSVVSAYLIGKQATMNRGSEHALLEPPSPAYTNVTVRRAFIVWLHCGQANKFKDVCNYYHYLEGLEDRLSAEARAISRRHEFDLFTNPPPTSPYISTNHPNLYTHTQLENYYVSKLEAIRNEKCVFKLEGFEEIGPKTVTKQEIVETSQLIRRYCLSHSIALKKFLNEFKTYASKCGLRNTVQNVANYIKRKMIKEEITMISNCPKTFSFLEEDVTVDDSRNFLNSQRKILDSIRLSPIVDCLAESWRSADVLQDKVLNAKNAFVKKPIQKQFVTPQREVIMINDFSSGMRQKYKSELIVS